MNEAERNYGDILYRHESWPENVYRFCNEPDITQVHDDRGELLQIIEAMDSEIERLRKIEIAAQSKSRIDSRKETAMADHKEIFLQPACCMGDEREWCQDGYVWDHYCNEGEAQEPTRYVRADIYDGLQAENEDLCDERDHLLKLVYDYIDAYEKDSLLPPRCIVDVWKEALPTKNTQHECSHPDAHENFGQMVCLDCQQHWSLSDDLTTEKGHG